MARLHLLAIAAVVLLVGCDRVERTTEAPAKPAAWSHSSLPVPTQGSLPVFPMDGPYDGIEQFCAAHDLDERCEALVATSGVAPLDRVITFAAKRMFGNLDVYLAASHAGATWVAPRKLTHLQVAGLSDLGSLIGTTERGHVFESAPIAELTVRVRGPGSTTDRIPPETRDFLLLCAVGRSGRPSCTAPIVVGWEFLGDEWRNQVTVGAGVVSLETTQRMTAPLYFHEDERESHLGSHPLGFP